MGAFCRLLRLGCLVGTLRLPLPSCSSVVTFLLQSDLMPDGHCNTVFFPLLMGASSICFSGLSYDTNETALKDAFSQHGVVIQGPFSSTKLIHNLNPRYSDSWMCPSLMTVKVVCHPRTGKSKGYGFVKFSSEDEAAAALHRMNGEVQYLSKYQ